LMYNPGRLSLSNGAVGSAIMMSPMGPSPNAPPLEDMNGALGGAASPHHGSINAINAILSQHLQQRLQQQYYPNATSPEMSWRRAPNDGDLANATRAGGSSRSLSNLHAPSSGAPAAVPPYVPPPSASEAEDRATLGRRKGNL
jgi:hypothetical protein